MSYKADLEMQLRESYKLIREYEKIVLLTSSPKEKASARVNIEDQWEIVKEALDMYIRLCQRLHVDLAEDIVELVAHFPQYDVPSPSLTFTTRQSIKPMNVFISYDQEDEQLCSLLIKHMQLLSREGVINEWHNRQINPGELYKDAIDQHFNAAQLILLLISADYIASDYCYGTEMTRALQRHAAHEARVIPIILRPVDWRSAPFGGLKALPMNGEPITAWADLDQAFLAVVNEIRKVVNEK